MDKKQKPQYDEINHIDSNAIGKKPKPIDDYTADYLKKTKK